MRFDTKQHKFYCGIDLHARTMSLCLLNQEGEILGHRRVPRVQDFVSACRLVQGAKESAGKRYGTSGAKRGHASLTWACSEAAGLILRANPAGQKYLAR